MPQYAFSFLSYGGGGNVTHGDLDVLEQAIDAAAERDELKKQRDALVSRSAALKLAREADIALLIAEHGCAYCGRPDTEPGDEHAPR